MFAAGRRARREHWTRRRRAGNQAATSSVTSRVRFVLEDSRLFGLGAGRMLTSTVEFDIRRGGGETGAGVELGGSLENADAARAVSRGARTHARRAPRRCLPRVGHGRGSVPLSRQGGAEPDPVVPPEWGAAGMGVAAERLWWVRDAGELAHGYGFDAGVLLVAELGDGLNAFRGRGTITLFFGTRSCAGGRDLRRGAGRRRYRPTTRCD